MAAVDGGNAAASGPDILDGGNATTTYDTVVSGGDAFTVYPAIAPELTGYTDGAPCPRVIINVTEVAAGTVTGTLHRIYGNNDDIVPGADNVNVTAGLVRTDYFAPLGVPIAYRMEMFDANGGSVGYTDAGTILLDVPNSTCWISSPFTPALSVQVELDDEAGSQLTKTVSASAHLIGNRRIVISEAVYPYSGIPLSFWVDTLADAIAAEQVFVDGAGLAVIRVAPPMQVPRVLYGFGMPARQEVNLPAGVEDTFFELTVDESTAPSTAVVAAVLTYGRFTDNLSSYADFTQKYGTYRDALLDPPAEL